MYANEVKDIMFDSLGFALMTLLHSDGTGDATTTLCHRYTPPEQLPVMTKNADIIIVATGTVSAKFKVSSSTYRHPVNLHTHLRYIIQSNIKK